ncbi:MAG: hypothetical protein H0T62_13480 [Parachlamydiaceae bacterium]|nr:hypothetical protein [Parachlamydiaceae bacterium]
MLRFFCSVIFTILALVLVLGGLWFLWPPFSSNALEWYLTKQIERQFGGHFHAQKVTWQNGRLLFESPSIIAIGTKKSEEKHFYADQVAVQYEYSLWDRKIFLKVFMKEPSFKVNSAAAMLVQTLLNKSTTIYTFGLNWQVSIPHGTLLQGNRKQFPFSLEIADEESSIGNFSLQFISDHSQSQRLDGYFFSNAPGEKSIHLDFNQIPLTELSTVLRYFDGPLSQLQITSGVVNGSANIRLEKKQIPSIDAELTFTDIIVKQPALELTSKISKAVLSLAKDRREKCKFELQGDSQLYMGSGNHLSELTGGIYWENFSNALINFHGKWANGKEPLSLSLDGHISPIFTETPLKLDLAFKKLNATLTDIKGNHFSAHFSDDFFGGNSSKLQFSGSALLAAKLLPATIAAALQRQFDLDRLSLLGLVKKENSRCTVDTTMTLSDSKDPIQETLMIAFDLENAQKFYTKKIDAFPFESYCCDIYLASTILLKPSMEGHYGISLTVEALNARVSDIQQLLSHFDKFTPLTALPLQGNIALGKKKNCFDLMFTPDGCKLHPSFFGSLSEGRFNGARQDLTFDDLAFDFTYDYDAKTLYFNNFQGALFLGAADNAEEYSLAGHSISFTDLRKFQATFDISLLGKEGNIFRLAGHTEEKTKEKEGKPFPVFFDKERSHINGMSLSRLDLTLNDAFHIEHFHLEFPLQLQKLIACGKILNKTKIWRDIGIGDIKKTALDSQGTLQVEMKYQQKSDIFVFNVKGSDLSFNSQKIGKCLLHGKKRGNLWSIEQLKIDKFSIAADFVKENQKWIFNFLGLRWGNALLMGLKGEYLANQQTFKGDIDLLEMNLGELKNIPLLYSLLSHLQPKGQFKGSGKLLISPKWETNLSLNFSITDPELLGLSFGEIQNATFDLSTGKLLKFRLELPKRGLLIDLAQNVNDISLRTHAPLIGTVAIDFGQITELMPSDFQKFMSEWNIRKKISFTGQWNFSQKFEPTDGYFSFEGNLKGENVQFKGYEFELLQANCAFSTNKVVLNNLTLQDPAGSLQIDQIMGVPDRNRSWNVSAGTCRLTNWRPSLMREMGKKSPESDTSLVISRLIIDRFQGIVNETSSFKGMGEFHFSQQSNRATNNPLFVVPMEIINRIGLDLSILTPLSGNVFFEILDDKIILTKLKDVYSDGKLSKFNLSSSNSSYIDFNGNLNLQMRMKHYSLFFKLAELFTFNVTGTLQKPIYSFKKQPRKTSRK